VIRPEVLVFDLFGTLVFFNDTRVPVIDVGGRRVPMTVAGLPQLLDRWLPHVALADFLLELRRVGAAVIEQKKREGIELHTSVRFERTLLALGCDTEAAAAAASEMAALHMDTLARAVVCPPGRPALLARLRATHRLALLSNFDHGATARRVLAEAGLEGFFESIVISEEVGLRKPSRAIFEGTCSGLRVDPSACLYIGDTFVEDIEGATGAGMSAVWIRAQHEAPLDPSPAVGLLADVDALPEWLAARIG